MYTYNISKKADQIAFKHACNLIENQIEKLKKEKLLTDVDGTEIQIYSAPDGKIKVFNDYEVDAVYVDSEVDLSSIF